MQIQNIIITQNPSEKYNKIRIQAENIIRMEIKIIISIKSFIFSLVLRIEFIFIIEVKNIILACI
jgi:hypothetical protein